jgi:hypothetical protein
MCSQKAGCLAHTFISLKPQHGTAVRGTDVVYMEFAMQMALGFCSADSD